MKFDKRRWLRATIGVCITAATTIPGVSWGGVSDRQSADYELAADVKLGEPNFWDYLTYDPKAKRVYAAHIDRVEVVDVSSGKSIGHVGPFHDVHGIAIVSELGKGYAASGDDGVVKVFNLADLSIVKTIKVSVDADGAVYDPIGKMVMVVAGDSKNLTLINVADDTVAKVVPLPGKPEFLALDGNGHVFVNIADHSAIARVDIGSGTVSANWPLGGCKDPHGLAYDPASKRLFSGCANEVMVVVDAATGNNLARLPIGSRSDSVVVDSTRHRAMSANGDGTLTVVAIGADDTYSVKRTVLTYFGGRNAAIDDSTGTLFLAHGNMKLMTGTKDLTKLRFGWDGLDVAVLKSND
ncbi:MAG: collagen triple helix repeat domain protein [Gammaproteobacteria bacterium]|nr:collagen triple helix repeat domain protein [Gammaproteobacteria bacterium]